MQHLSRHIALNYDHFGYFNSQKYLLRFQNLTAIVFVFGHFKMSSSRNPSITKLHRNKVFILPKVSKCHSVNQEIVNIFKVITTVLTPLCRYFYYLQHAYNMQLRELNNKGARAKTMAQAIFLNI